MTQNVTILVYRKDRVGLITLNRPHPLNAFNPELMREVIAAATDFEHVPTSA